MWNFVAKPPLRGKCVEVVSALPIVDTFYLFWPRVAEKPTNDFFKMKDTTFPISHLQQLFSFDKKNVSPTTGLWSKWRANREAGFYLPEQNNTSIMILWELDHRCSTDIKENEKKVKGSWPYEKNSGWNPESLPWWYNVTFFLSPLFQTKELNAGRWGR